MLAEVASRLQWAAVYGARGLCSSAVGASHGAGAILCGVVKRAWGLACREAASQWANLVQGFQDMGRELATYGRLMRCFRDPTVYYGMIVLYYVMTAYTCVVLFPVRLCWSLSGVLDSRLQRSGEAMDSPCAVDDSPGLGTNATTGLRS